MNTYFLKKQIASTYAISVSPDATHISDSKLDPCVLTIGNFDGVHLGHQVMLAQVRQLADEQGISAAVMIFEPQPREFFAPKTAPARLTTLSEKQALLAEYGVDTLIVAEFDDHFRALSATAFADLLAQRLHVRSLVLGDDFRFGHDRTGDSQFFQKYGLPVTDLQTVTDNRSSADVADNHQRISSTRVRDLLLSGDLDAANQLLGRDYTITGTVVAGDQIGRTMDFPTANIDLNRLKPALHGIFAVDVVCLDAQGDVIANGLTQDAIDQQVGVSGLRPHSLFGTASIGTRPSVKGASEWRLEVHFPKLKADLYGKTLQVRFLHYLHGERNYDGLAALKLGIHQDVEDLLNWREEQLR